VELLHLEIAEPITQEPRHVLGRSNPRPKGTLLASQSSAQLESRRQPGRLGATDPSNPAQLSEGPARQSAQRSFDATVNRFGNRQDMVPRPTGS
jgi:hypothetical protein